MKPRPERRVSIPGAGPGITWEAGAAAALDSVFDVVGWAGTSAGALIATLKAFAVPDDVILHHLKNMLRDGKMIDIVPDGRMGLLQWEAIPALCDKVLGPSAKMDDALTDLVVCVSDLDTGLPQYISKKKHPKVLLREVLPATASFAPGLITPICTIPSLGTEMSPDISGKGDGGWTDNCCSAVWDDCREPTIHVRFHEADIKRVRDWQPIATASALMKCGLNAANANRSVRRHADGQTAWLSRDGSWNFQKPDSLVEKEYHEGYDAVMAQCRSGDIR